MAKPVKNNKTVDELEAVVTEFDKKLEVLRVRYEQYFIGVEKVAPSTMRMDVARIMRELEQVNTQNTALKFKIRQSIQKFTSYSQYWNRTMREIEDGTYKRHLDRAKRHQTSDAGVGRTAENMEAVPKAAVAANPEVKQAVADEAEAFLASLGMSSGSSRGVKQAAQQQAPSLAGISQQAQRAPSLAQQQAPSLTGISQQTQRAPSLAGISQQSQRAPSLAGTSQQMQKAPSLVAMTSVSSGGVVRPAIRQSGASSVQPAVPAGAAANTGVVRPTIRPAVNQAAVNSPAPQAARPAVAPPARPAVAPPARPAAASSSMNPPVRPAVAPPARPAAAPPAMNPPARPAAAPPLHPGAPQIVRPAIPGAAPKPPVPGAPKIPNR